MSLKQSSLALEEVKTQNQRMMDENHFEPALQLLINKAFSKSSVKLDGSDEIVTITGRMIVSF